MNWNGVAEATNPTPSHERLAARLPADRALPAACASRRGHSCRALATAWRSPTRAHGKASWVLLVVTAVIAGAIFAQLKRQPAQGSASGAAATAAAPPATNAAPAKSSAPVESLVAPLAARLAENPDDPTGWTLLAQSYEYMGQPGKAADAYRQALAHGATDPSITAALTAAENAFISQTLLGTGGSAAGGVRAPSTTSTAPGTAANQAPNTSPASTTRTATSAAANTTATAEINMPSAAAGSVPTAASGGAVIRGMVALATSLADRVRPQDTVFVYARAANGPPMPLAVLRFGAAQLPLDFVLDDSTAMSPGRGLSSAERVTVVARVSRSGNAISQPGDLIGESPPLDPRAGQPLALTIDRVVETTR